jgi:hypothetical protein
MKRQPDCRLEVLEMLIVEADAKADTSTQHRSRACKAGLSVIEQEAGLASEAYRWLATELQLIRQRIIDDQYADPLCCESCVHEDRGGSLCVACSAASNFEAKP